MMKKIILLALSTMMSATLFAANPVGNTATPSGNTSEVEALFSVTGQQVVETAQHYLGRPYHRGSKGHSSFDCSGFTSYIYKSLNIKLNNCSRSQYNEGLSVDRDNLQVGDLVFFAGRNSRGGIGHVGIVSKVNEDGSFNFIHASCSNGVTISNINEAYYSNRYKGARRILEDCSDVLAYNK